MTEASHPIGADIQGASPQTVASLRAALDQSEQRARTLFAHSPLGLLVVQVEAGGRVVAIEGNAAFYRSTGLDADAVIGRPIDQAMAETGAVLAADCVACLAEGGFESQHSLRFPIGERLLHTYYRPLPGDPAQGRRVLLTQVDHTESRRVEAAMRQAMRLEVVGQLTGGVAHEFNNLLTAVLGSLDLLGRRLKDERSLHWVEIASSAARRGAALIDQLLSYARKQFMAPVATDVPACLGTMMELIRGSLGSRIALATDLSPDTWHAVADPAQLQLALLNLLVNARDAMPHGGQVALSTQNRAAGHPELPPELLPGDYVVLAVADTGVGMTADILAHVMEPFFTTKAFGAGSGLGLSQAHGVASQLGGTLRLLSTPGAGTTAQMFLPRAQEAGQAGAMPLLLVDDDVDVRSIAGALLREDGWEVCEAADGAHALQAIATRRFAALLADLAMPGLSGEELAIAARRQQPGLPVLFRTGNADPEVLSALPGPVLRKPYSMDALLDTVREAVRGSDRA